MRPLSSSISWKIRLATLGVFLWFLTLRAKYIQIFNADIGRHLANGKWVFQHPDLLFKNFYSYTYPEYPFLNHHWGSGIIFHFIQEVFGFTGLSLFFLLISSVTLLLLFGESSSRYGKVAPLWATLTAVPMLAFRSEIRPEAFSELFCVLTWIALSRWKDSDSLSANRRILIALSLLAAIWVNLHIFFVFEFVIIACFLVEKIIRRQPTQWLVTLVFFCLIAVCINPTGLSVLIGLPTSFSDYGYRIAENQSIPFFIKRAMNSQYIYAFLFSSIFMIIGIYKSLTRSSTPTRSLPPPHLILIVCLFWALAFGMIRHLPYFALFSIPFNAALVSGLQKSIPVQSRKILGKALAAVAIGINAFFVFANTKPNLLSQFFPHFGLQEGVERPIEFFKQNRLEGPIFNNYDIGGFLIYYLFPDERVFVDNRPEAYPSSFLRDQLVPMQENDEIWRAAEQQFSFNTIFYYWHDLTPHSQTFLRNRLNDPTWVPVYVDGFSLILVKNSEKNRELIRKYRIPREVFRFRPARSSGVPESE